MTIINANVPPVQLVSLTTIPRGSAFRSGSDYFVVLGLPASGNVPIAPLGGGAVANMIQTTMVETVRLDSCDVTISPA